MTTTRLQGFLANVRRMHTDERGNVAMIMALLLVPLVGAVGYGIDYTRAVSYKMKLDSAAHAAALAGIDTARALLLSNPNMSPDSVKAAADARALQVFTGLAPTEAPYIFKSLGFNRVGETMSGSVSYSATVPTTFTNVVGLQNIAIDGGSESQGPLAQGTTNPTNPDILVEENFDAAGSIAADVKYRSVDGIRAYGMYTNFNNWKTTSNGVEVGENSLYGSMPPNGAPYVGELDSTGNAYMAKKIYLPVGNYELRYYYMDRVSYDIYAPANICGSTSTDVEWTSAAVGTWFNRESGTQSNRLGVYLDLASGDNPPAKFSANMIDVCILSHRQWIERSVKISVTAPGSYWLAFQAEGASEGLGAVVNNIRFCKNTCPGEVVAEKFPWSANTLLFTDNFTLPSGIWPADYFTQHMLNTSGAATTASKWQNVSAGWTTTPVNQVEFVKVSGYDYVLPLDASSSGSISNRSIHRKLLLAPGYYKLTYEYSPFNGLGTFGTWCGALTTSEINLQVSQVNAAKSDSAKAANTNQMSVYVDADVSFSHPETTTTLSNAAVWKAWDGSSPASGAAKLPNTRIDSCVHSTSKPIRSVHFKISKTGYYWLTFAGEGAADGFGARVDSIALTAVGGLSTAAPSSFVSIPPHGFAPGSKIKSKEGGYEFTSN